MTEINILSAYEMNFKTWKALRNFQHPCVDEIEREGMDEGRFFAHLKEDYCWDEPYSQYGNVCRTKSFGTVGELRDWCKTKIALAKKFGE